MCVPQQMHKTACLAVMMGPEKRSVPAGARMDVSMYVFGCRV